MDNIATLKGLKCPYCGCEQVNVTGTKGALGASLATSLAFGAVGNLVAGSKAAANQATEPLQYKCVNCKKKFESMPLIAPAEDVLPVPCTVTFTRVGSFVGAAVPQIVHINGVKVGAVKNGKSISFTTSNRYNVIFVSDQSGVAYKGDYRFEAQPGGNVTVRFKRRFLDAPINSNVPPVSAAQIVAVPSYPSSVSAQALESGSRPQVRFCTKCGASLGSQSMFCPSCGEKRYAPGEAASSLAGNMQYASQGAALSAKPSRAVVTFITLAISWILLLLIQGAYRGRLWFNADVTLFMVLAMLGTCSYLLLQKEVGYKLSGIAFGLITVFLSAGTTLSIIVNNRRVGFFSLADALGFKDPYYWTLFRHALLFTALTLGASILAGYILRHKPDKARIIGTAGIAGGVYALCSLFSWLIQNRHNLNRVVNTNLLSVILGIICDALILFLAMRFLYSLCHMQQSRVRLFGIGKAWAIIATIGVTISLFVILGAVYGGSRSRYYYTPSLLQAIAGAIGYIMLLCKRRTGLYIILASAVLVLGGQFLSSIVGLQYQPSRYGPMLFGSIIAGLNPLFAWLSVRAADRRG